MVFPVVRFRKPRAWGSRPETKSGWGQLTQKKQPVAEASKLEKVAARAAPPTFHDVDGRTHMEVDVKGYGRCGLLSVYALSQVAKGTPVEEVSSRVFPDNGEGDISDELERTLQGIRDAVAHAPDSALGGLCDGEEAHDLEDVMKKPSYMIRTKNMFRTVALMANGYVDDLMLRLAAQHLDMDGLRVVSVVDGELVTVDALPGKYPDKDAPLVLHDGQAHFKALIPWTSGAPADAPTTEQREASGGIDAAAETGGDDGLDTTDRGNGWYVVGKSRRTTTGSEGTNRPQYTSENQFDVLCGEDEENDDEGMFTVVWKPRSSAQLLRYRSHREGARPPRRGRRVAGRRKAQPSTRAGQGGSKYLKPCPARDTRVERKRGGGRGQEARGETWSGVVRGGARPGDEEAPASAGAIPSASASSFPSSSEAPGDAAPVDGRCKADACSEVATWGYRGGEVQFCQKHTFKTDGWAPKMEGRRKRTPSAKVTEGANTGALDDDDEPEAKKRRAAPVFDGAVPTGPTASTSSPIGSRGRGEGYGRRKNNGRDTCQHTGCTAATSRGVTGTTRPGGATTAPMDTDGDGGDGGDGSDGDEGSDGLDGSVEAMAIGEGADSDGDGINEGSGDDGPDTTPMEIGGGGGGGAGTGGGGAGGGGRTSGKKTARVNKPVGQRGLRSTTLAQELEEPILACMEPFLENNRRASDELVEERRDTAPRAPNKPAGTGTIADAARFLAMLSHDKKDSIEIKEGVYFPRSSKSEIKSQYELDYAFDPSDIGVEVGRTTVTWGNKVQTVEAFDYGIYTLGDKKSKLTQWDVLENRHGRGVTLEQDLRRYIGQLVLTYVVMQSTGVPEIENDGNVHDGMMLDVYGGLANAEKSLDGIDSLSQLGREELLRIKTDTDRVRDFALEIFTGSSVRDILPVPRDDKGEDKPTRDFLNRPGSLKELNFMADLNCTDNNEKAFGHLLDGKVVRGGKNWVPKAKLVRGSWKAKLKMIVRLLMCAYRLGRPVNFVEAYLGVSPEELDVLKKYNTHWDKNLRSGFDGLPFDTVSQHAATGKQLDGKNKWAYRLAVQRSNDFYNRVTPVVAFSTGTRDPLKYGEVQDHSKDSNFFQNMRGVYSGLLERAMGLDSPSLKPVLEALGSKDADELLKKSRACRKERSAEVNGAIGEGTKERRNKLILIRDPRDRRFTLTMAFQMSLGEKLRPLLTAVTDICPGFYKLATTCLVKAKKVSTSYTKKILPNGDRALYDVIGEDHLLGNSSEAKKWVAKVVEGLDERGFECRDICRLSVYTQLGLMFNAAALRDGDFFHLSANTMYYNNKRGTLLMRPPAKGKQTESANGELKNVLKEHEIWGPDVIRWCMVMNLVGRAFLRKKNGNVDPEFGPLAPDGQRLSDDVFKKVVASVGRTYFGVDNADVYSMRTVQDTMAAEDLVEVGLDHTAHCVQDLFRRQRTTEKNGTNTYSVIRSEKTTATKELKTPMDLNGGVRRMQVEKRKREGFPKTPSDGLWDEEEFVELYREMASMKPPRIPEKVNTDFGFKYESESEPESESGSGSGSESGSRSTSTLKSELGAGPDTVTLFKTSCGSAMRPIDVELADAEKKRAIAKAEFERMEFELKRAEMAQKLENLKRGGAPDSHVASGPVFAAQSATAAAATVAPGARPAAVIGGRDDVGAGGAAGDQNGGAVGALTSGKGVAKATKRKNKTKPKLASPVECDGVREVVAALRTAFAKAKLRNNDAKAAGKEEDDVHKFMTKKRIFKSMLPLAYQLLALDKEYKPGDWFTKHKDFGVGGYPKGFTELVEKVENQIDGFRWSSWKHE